MVEFEIKDGIAIIPEGTTVVPKLAFANQAELREITILEGVTII
jgi:hypothetical protein